MKLLIQIHHRMSMEKLCAKLICDDSVSVRLEDIDKSHADRIPIGTVEFVREFCKQTGISLPKSMSYPVELRKYLGREITETTFGEADENNFVKPVETKLFTGGIKKDIQEKVPGDTKVFSSKPVKFNAEWRYYVHNGKLLGAGQYDSGDDEREPPSTPMIEDIIKDFVDAPVGYAIDLGETENGLVLVEINDGWSLGYYPWGSCTKIDYARLITDRWHEIVQNNS